MKKITRISGVLAALAAVLACAGALCASLRERAVDPALYAEQSRRILAQALGSEEAVSAYVGLDAEGQREAAEQIARYMKDGGELKLEMLNEKERMHLADVRVLSERAEKAASVGISIAAGLSVICAWLNAAQKKKHAAIGIGAAAGAGVTVLTAAAGALLLRTAGFSALFEKAHRLLFDNELWRMDPAKDILIRMMPEGLFMQAGIQVLMQTVKTTLIVWLLLAAVYLLVGNMIARHLQTNE